MHPTLLFSELPRTLAYLDPGSGSLIVQMLIAAIVGGGLLLRTFWSKLTGKSKKAEEDMDETEKDEEGRQS
jgi:hypothetical protein